MTYLVIWEFDVAVERRDEFESAYGPRGPWRDLFAPADGYLGTELVRAPSGSRYLTLDRWDQRVSYDTFMSSRADDYRVLDVRLEGIAQTERRIGDFDTVD
jgi:hypothetical protein